VLRGPPPPFPWPLQGPSPPTNEGPGIVGQAVCRTPKLLGVGPLENFTYKCDLLGLNTVNQRNIHHQFKRTGETTCELENITGILRPGPVPRIHSYVLYITCSLYSARSKPFERTIFLSTVHRSFFFKSIFSFLYSHSTYSHLLFFRLSFYVSHWCFLSFFL
jgi:hypothetical protein